MTYISPYIFIRLSVWLHSAMMRVIFPDRHEATRIWTKSSSTGLWSRQGGWCRLCSAGSAQSLTFSLHVCSMGHHSCLWWYWSYWGVLLSVAVPEVATCWDLDSSRCEGETWTLVKLKSNPLFLYIPPMVQHWKMRALLFLCMSRRICVMLGNSNSDPAKLMNAYVCMEWL